MKTTFLVPFLLLGFMISCNTNKEKQSSDVLVEAQPLDSLEQLERGEYLVELGGCHHCHSPKIMSDRGPIADPDRLLSGHPSDETLPPYDEETAKGYVLFTMGLTSTTGPWGTSFAANLTPDDSGIGTWSEEQFFTALRKGKHKGLEGSRPILPPMPWEDLGKMTDEDLKALFAYLKSMKPVENVVPPARLAQMEPQ
ncbi:c-type cytochrome [Aestuariivivens sediminicola]|uniref:c-type cytochrome n=1 Tax=Aestuariivivens sediminicola TaxID=2913560 RepID=UPI001F5808D1|nr:c-type cytochrome [Aestuariivivens sediminicola]